MSKIQFANLSSAFDEETLRGLLEERGYPVSNISLKGSSATVSLIDPQSVEEAVDCLNGKYNACKWKNAWSEYRAFWISVTLGPKLWSKMAGHPERLTWFWYFLEYTV